MTAAPEPFQGPSRRQFLQRAALLAAGTPTLAALLEACTRSSGTGGGGAAPKASLTLAAPSNPVKWPVDESAMIKDGLTPEKGATLRLYNYADYSTPAPSSRSRRSTRNTMSRSACRRSTTPTRRSPRSGPASVPYDIYFPSYDQISRLVGAKLIRPLNHSYITNIDNVWAAFQDPWYDRGWQYTVPYTVYTTGIGWRTDKVPHRHRGSVEPLRHALEQRVQGPDSDHRRLAHCDGDVPAAGRQDRRQHR